MTVAPLEEARNAALLAWYADQQRSLPWRDQTDPYVILVAEVMLQQTQASRVVPFYNRFVARFPTVEALASAVLQDVLDAWTGLGYNARALRLREAARIIQSDGWPTTAETLSNLPGVGPYTAAAVASFALRRAHTGRRHELPTGLEPVARRVASRSSARRGGRGCPRRAGKYLEPGDDGSRCDAVRTEGPPLYDLPGQRLVLRSGRVHPADRSRAVRGIGPPIAWRHHPYPRPTCDDHRTTHAAERVLGRRS